MSPCLGRLKSFLATSTPSIQGQRLSFIGFNRLMLSRRITVEATSSDWGFVGRSHTAEEVLVDLLAVVLRDKP